MNNSAAPDIFTIIEGMKAQMGTFSLKVNEMIKARESFFATIKALLDELDDLLRQLNNPEIMGNRKKIDELNRRIRILIQENAELTTKNAALTDKNAALTDKNAVLSQQINDLQEQIIALQHTHEEEMGALIQEHTNKMGALQRQHAQKMEELTQAHEAQMAALQQEMTALKAEMAALRNEMINLQAQMDALRTERISIEQAIEQLNTLMTEQFLLIDGYLNQVSLDGKNDELVNIIRVKINALKRVLESQGSSSGSSSSAAIPSSAEEGIAAEEERNKKQNHQVVRNNSDINFLPERELYKKNILEALQKITANIDIAPFRLPRQFDEKIDSVTGTAINIVSRFPMYVKDKKCYKMPTIIDSTNYLSEFRDNYNYWYYFWFPEPTSLLVLQKLHFDMRDDEIFETPKGGKPKKTKRKTKKNKRINKMRRGGWTYKGSPSLDSKSSIITDTSSKTSSKTRSKSSSSKSKTKSKSKTNRNNKKHKTKKVIKRSRR
jgi:hypothetical protein